ncbi:glycosyltransferase family 39 protein [Adhaeribacter sp. BT258]|uniref:Glycosyltransferase family 39 protein n=1 Tax=Adhaeribacter terrigena TaxID=2793070 RepID=A0ABS1C192_9BACT|nr:glycosyltransferase family 39 protein [Adhaeribacter terrigena]MBK0403166.1 glycosyltransferase family 39 protein [Adhaeribacter terrigena]
MQPEYRQLLRYGFGILSAVAGLLLVFFAANAFLTFEQLFEVFRYEIRFTGNPYPFGFSFRTYQIVISSLAFLTLGSWFLFYFFRPPAVLNLAEAFGLHLKTLGFPLKKLRQQWTLLPTWEKKVLLVTGVLLVATRIYLLRLHPVITDEAATYLLFVSKGLKGSLTYYPLPNNHILYSVLCLPFDLIIGKAYWVLKLPALLISLALFPVVYLGLRSVFKFPVAFIAAVGCAFSNYALYYAVHGRGYTLLLFCTAIASLAMLKIVQQRAPVYWFIFMLASVAGFLTIPVFLYPFASLVLFGATYFLFVRNFCGFQHLIIACLFIGSVTALLYLPAMLVSGGSQLYGNDYVQAGDRQTVLAKLPFYISYMHGAMLGQETLGKYVWLLGIGVFLFLLLFRRRLTAVYEKAAIEPVILGWVVCGSLLPFLFLVLHGVMPPERIWLFLVFADFLMLGILFQVTVSFLSAKYQKTAPVFTVAFMALFAGYQLAKQQRDAGTDHSQSKIVENALRNIHPYGYRTVFSNCNAYGMNVIYEFLYSGEGDYVFDENTPKPGRQYDVVIVGTENPAPVPFGLSGYFLFHDDPRMKIYFRRKPQTQIPVPAK